MYEKVNDRLTKKTVYFDGGYAEGGNYYFYLRNHLGSVTIVAKEDDSVVQNVLYYPFGAPLIAFGNTRHVQPYKFGEKEFDMMHGLNWYDFSARHYDGATGRFMTPDPMAEKYYNISPYAYCMNNPINAIDVDGRLTIFVNGFNPLERIGFLGVQVTCTPSPYPELRMPITYAEFVDDSFKTKDEYGWGGLDEFYKKHYNDPNALYVSGSNAFGGSASIRYTDGMRKAKELIEKIKSGELVLAEGEKIRLVGYSMGAAYAAGMASVLADSPYGSLLEFVDYIAAHQPTGFEHPADILGRQFGSLKDIFSGKGKQIKNIDDINRHIGDFGGLWNFGGHILGDNFDLNRFIMEVINNGGTVTVYN